jgi:hypothetical protein
MERDKHHAVKNQRGRPSKLTASQKEEIIEAITHSPSKFGLPLDGWTPAAVSWLIKDKLAVTTTPKYGWEILPITGFVSLSDTVTEESDLKEKVEEWSIPSTDDEKPEVWAFSSIRFHHLQLQVGVRHLAPQAVVNLHRHK